MNTPFLSCPASTRQTTVARVDRKASLEALGKALERLSLADRQVVALYYVGGLTMEEISTGLKLSRETVSGRLKRALEQLRAELRRMNCSEALPMVNAHGLNEVICEGFRTPPGLYARVMEGVSGPRRSGHPAPPPEQVGRFLDLDLCLWVLAVVVAACWLGLA